jgi:predicted ATPase/DNA-binding SARP family transcriptional activator
LIQGFIVSQGNSAQVRLTLFGSPQVVRADGTAISFRSRKHLALLLYLALEQRHSSSRDTLLAMLWPEADEEAARNNLRVALADLRRALGEGPFLQTTRHTVQYDPGSEHTLDVLAFRELFDASCAHNHEALETCVACLARLERAVALYRGDFLHGFSLSDSAPFEEWALVVREQLHQQALEALAALADAYEQRGDHAGQCRCARRQIELEPWREQAHAQLMRGLWASGQRGAALEQYETCRRILADELGLSPSSELAALAEQLRAAAPATAPATELAAPHMRHNLPTELTEFIGRAGELQQILRQLQDPTCRLLTIAGLGGIGKTRLALAAAQTILDSLEVAQNNPTSHLQHPPFSDGVYFAPLAGLEPINQVEQLLATTIAETVQLPLSGAAPTTQLIHALHDKAMLIVLDNFEHLTAAAPFVSALLQSTRSIKLLVTSRTRLNVQGEYLVSLDGLGLPPMETLARPEVNVTEELATYGATHLFVRRAQAIASPVALDRATGRAIVRMCHLLQGLPLGIELAATWTRLLSCADIVIEIQRNLDFLDNTLADAPAQQRSLRAVFNHSWRLLSAPEQQCLRRLALFHRGFTRSAAAGVAGATLPHLARLLDKSLVRRSASPPDLGALDNADPDIRYELPETIRQYAAEQLVEAGEQELVAARHAAYYTDWLAAQRPNLAGINQQDALRAIGAEIENIRVAWQWGCHNLTADNKGLAQIAQGLDSLFHFYDMRSWFEEGAAMFAYATGALAARLSHMETDPTYGLVHAKLQARQGWFAFHLGRFAESRALLETSLARLRQLNAEAEMIFSHNYLGAVLRHLGEFEQAQRSVQEALALAQRHANQPGASIALNILGQLALLQGDYVQAQVFCRQALQIKRAIGDRWGMTYSLTYLGRVAQATGDYVAAQSRFHESLAICQQIGDQRGVAFALQNLADTAHLSGQYTESRKRYGESLHIYRAIGSHAEASLTLARLGELACTEGAYDQAAAHLREALEAAWSVQSMPGILAAVLGMALLDIAIGHGQLAAPVLALVYNHPASNQAQKQKAAQVLAELGADATPGRAANMTLDEYVGMRLDLA